MTPKEEKTHLLSSKIYVHDNVYPTCIKPLSLNAEKHPTYRHTHLSL